MISGKTTLIAHLGYPTFAFKSPMIYNPWFEKNDIDAVVVPMGVQAPRTTRILPVPVQADQHPRRAGDDAAQGDHDGPGRRDHADRRRWPARPTPCCCARTARCSATSSTAPGFVRGVLRKGFDLTGKRALVVGNGGVGSPIAASLAAAGVGGDGPVRPERRGVGGARRSACAEPTRTCRSTTGSKDPDGLRPRRQRHAAGDERRRPAADGRRPDRPGHVRRRGRDEAGDHPVPAGGAGQGLPDPGRQGHAVRADPGLPGVLRLRHRHPRGAARRLPGRGADRPRWRA